MVNAGISGILAKGASLAFCSGETFVKTVYLKTCLGLVGTCRICDRVAGQRRQPEG